MSFVEQAGPKSEPTSSYPDPIDEVDGVFLTASDTNQPQLGQETGGGPSEVVTTPTTIQSGTNVSFKDI